MSTGEDYPQGYEFSSEEMVQLFTDAQEMHRLYELGRSLTEFPADEDGTAVAVSVSAMPVYHHDEDNYITVVAPENTPFPTISLITQSKLGDLRIAHGVTLNINLMLIDNEEYVNGPITTLMDVPVHDDGSALMVEEQKEAGFRLVAHPVPKPLQRDDFTRIRQYLDEALNLFRQLS